MAYDSDITPDDLGVIVQAIAVLDERDVGFAWTEQLTRRPHAATSGQIDELAQSLAFALDYPYIDMGPLGFCDRCKVDAWPTIECTGAGGGYEGLLCTRCLPAGATYVPGDDSLEWMRSALIEHAIDIPSAQEVLASAGSAVSEALAARGLTPDDLVDQAGLDPAEVQGLVRGDMESVSAATLIRCAEFLQCEVGALLDPADLVAADWRRRDASPDIGMD